MANNSTGFTLPGLPEFPGFPTLPDPSAFITQGINAINNAVSSVLQTIQNVGNSFVSGVGNTLNQLKPPDLSQITQQAQGVAGGQASGLVPFQIPTPEQLRQIVMSGINI